MDPSTKSFACKKGKIEKVEFGLKDKLNFYRPAEKYKFESYKSMSIAYGRTISLSHMKDIHYDVLTIFDFQKLSSLFNIVSNYL